MGTSHEERVLIMKRLMAMGLVLACVLAGCGDKKEDTSSKASEVNTTAAEETTAETTAAEETTTEAETTQEQTTEEITTEAATEEAETDIGAFKAAYRSAIEEKIDYVYSEIGSSLMLDFTLFDLDKDRIPELFVKYGTGEVNFRIAAYTFKDGELQLLMDDIPGGHSSFGWDYERDLITIDSGHMGGGDIKWYHIDENGEFRFLEKTEPFTYNSEEGPTYEEILKENNVLSMDFCQFSNAASEKTTICRHRNGELEYDEYEGFDYRYLEDYLF